MAGAAARPLGGRSSAARVASSAGRECATRRLTRRRNRRSWPARATRASASRPLVAGLGPRAAAPRSPPTARWWSRRVRSAAASAAASPSRTITTWRSWRSPRSCCTCFRRRSTGAAGTASRTTGSSRYRARFTRMRAACASAWFAGERIRASRRPRSLPWSSSSSAITDASAGGRVASGAGADPRARRRRRASRSNFGAIRSRMSPYARSRRSVSRAMSQGTPARRAGASSLRWRSSQEIWTSTSRASPVARARSRSRRRSLAGTTASSCAWYARSVLRSRRIATRKSCRASTSFASASRSRAALAASSRVRAMRRAAPGASAVRRPSERSGTRAAQQPQVPRAEEPVEGGAALADGTGELEEAGRALAQLQERPVRGGEQGADQSAEIGLVAHDRHGAARVPGREPADHAVHTHTRRELRHPLHGQIAVGARDDLRGIERPLVGARGQHIELRNERLQAEGGPLHLVPSLRREGPVRVVLVRARERLAIFRDGMPDDEEAHRLVLGRRGLAVRGPRGGPSHDRHEGRADVGALAGGLAREVLEGDLGPQHRLALTRGAPAVGAVGEQLAHLDGV